MEGGTTGNHGLRQVDKPAGGHWIVTPMKGLNCGKLLAVIAYFCILLAASGEV